MSMRKIYRQIAKKYGVSVESVKQDMQEAIEKTYGADNGCDEKYKIAEGDVPTTEQFINYVADKVKKGKED